MKHFIFVLACLALLLSLGFTLAEEDSDYALIDDTASFASFACDAAELVQRTAPAKKGLLQAAQTTPVLVVIETDGTEPELSDYSPETVVHGKRGDRDCYAVLLPDEKCAQACIEALNGQPGIYFAEKDTVLYAAEDEDEPLYAAEDEDELLYAEEISYTSYAPPILGFGEIHDYVLENKQTDEVVVAVIGAVNTVYLREGKWIGENTDGKGFVRSLTDAGASPEDKLVTLLGAGGAAKAIGVECALAGAKRIYIFNRNRERGEALAETIRKNTAAEAEYFPWNGSVKIPEDSDILINATCVGLFPDVDACPDVDFETLKPGTVVSDVVFNPVRTVFLCRAEAKGAKILTGTGMLVNQAAENFRLWTGETASRETMMNALVKEFGEA